MCRLLGRFLAFKTTATRVPMGCEVGVDDMMWIVGDTESLYPKRRD